MMMTAMSTPTRMETARLYAAAVTASMRADRLREDDGDRARAAAAEADSAWSKYNDYMETN